MMIDPDFLSGLFFSPNPKRENFNFTLREPQGSKFNFKKQVQKAISPFENLRVHIAISKSNFKYQTEKLSLHKQYKLNF
jgi:hypothetical protein